MYSQFFVLSPRGDTLLFKDYRGDVPKGSTEVFFRKVKFWKGDAPPIFLVDGVSYLHSKKNGLLFVFTTKFNVSPCLSVEVLDRMTKVFKDYCGVLSEESIRKNFILLYELLDEMIDYGCPQNTTTEHLKMYVHNEPIPVEDVRGGAGGLRATGARTTPSSAVHRPISVTDRAGKKNEIFVDVLERLTVLFNSNGYILNSVIDGTIQMKSYLSGNPGLRLALNEDLVVGKGGSSGRGPSYGGVVLDDCNFHECVNLDDFEATRTLALVPPDGEFAVMNYRVTGEFRAPFRVFPFLEESSPFKVELVVKVRADMPESNYGSNVVIRFPVPRNAATVHPELGPAASAAAVLSTSKVAPAASTAGQAVEYKAKDKQVVWTIKKFSGGTELTLRTKISLSSASTGSVRKELGPISMSFEIPMYNVSNLQIRYLRIAEAHKSYKPFRWVRYVTQSNSYVSRL